MEVSAAGRTASSAGLIRSSQPDDHGGSIEALESAFLIWDDFAEDGLYWERGTSSDRNSNNRPVDWGRTVATEYPFMSRAGPAFLGVRNTYRKRTLNGDLGILQRNALREIAGLFGFPVAELGSVPEEIAATTNQIGHELFSRLRYVTYRDRGRRLLDWLQTWFLKSELHSEVAGDGLIAVSEDGFEYVWETIVRTVFGGGSTTGWIPSGIWTTPNGTLQRGIAPRIDALVSSDEDIAIVDAKYKSSDSSGLIGSEADHYKQVAYRQLLNPAKIGARQVNNFLVFPVYRTGHTLVFLGDHRWPDWPRSRVIVVGLDFPIMVGLWLSGRRLDFISQIRQAGVTLDCQDSTTQSIGGIG